MRIRQSKVVAGGALVLLAAIAGVSCGGERTDGISDEAGVGDAQVTDGGATDAKVVDAADAASDAADAACPPHQTTCTGACTDTGSDLNACGRCGNHCGANEVCSNGTCASICASTEAACTDADGGLHCADALHDNANCGYCGNACPPGDACSNGKCALACVSSETKCVAGDGTAFCVDLQTDLQNCNACGNACPTTSSGTATCAAGKCGVTCNAGVLDCNANPADGCEANPASDLTNCGGCGTICPVGAYCYSGICGCPASPVGTTLELCGSACTDIERDPTNCGSCGTRCTASSANQSASCIESACRYSNRAVSAPLGTTGVVLDETYVYFAEYGVGIRRVTKGSIGEAPVTIIADDRVSGLALHGGTFFWTSMNGVFACPKTGCVGAPTVLLSADAQGSRILADDTNIYFQLYFAPGAGLAKCPQTGCSSPPAKFFDQYLESWALGPSSVFGLTYSSATPPKLYSITTSDPPTSTVVYGTYSQPDGLAYHAGHLYFFTGGNLVQCDPDNCVPTVLTPQPLDYNGNPAVNYYAGPIIADDTSVIWAVDGIHELNLSSGTDAVIADIKSGVIAFALDATNVYWAGNDGVYWAAR